MKRQVKINIKAEFSRWFFDFFEPFVYNWKWIIYHVFIAFMKKTLKKLILCGMIMGFCIIPTENLQIKAAENNVPDYYYANYKFADDWNSILTWFTKAKAKYKSVQYWLIA